MDQERPVQTADNGAAWHARPPAEVASALATGEHGLSAEEAALRLERFGPNELPAPAERSALVRFLTQFNSTLIYFLLAATVAALLLDHAVDAAVILAVVILNAVVGFLQEGRAERALAAIQDMIAPVASVLREGQRDSVPARKLVPGDAVLLDPGDRVPADIRLFRATGLLIDEAALTGESVAAAKSARAVPSDTALGDREGMAHAGTMVLAGQGAGIVTGTGRATEIGRISRMVAAAGDTGTPLLRQIDRFGRGLTVFAALLSAALFAVAVTLRGQPVPEALLNVVALAVALVPEGLPAVITVALAIGVQRMARRHAIIRRLPAVEALGSTTVICTDKTGTLTRNEMTATRMATGAGDVRTDDAAALRLALEGPASGAAIDLLRAGMLCNDAQLAGTPQGLRVSGDPMEGALLALGASAGLSAGPLRTEWPRLAEIPFDARHRYMATLHRAPEGRTTVYVKGAPETILGMCRTEDGPEGPRPVDSARWHARIHDYAAEGLRVLGFATAEGEGANGLHPLLQGRNLVFLGIVGFIDPPRPEAIDAVADCRAAGIDVRMITGDHAATAAAIARQLRLSQADRVVTGREIDATEDADLPGLVKETGVFARAAPEHKLRLVRALQAEGHVVAMTGDGVNDAPALQQADIGVAMGRKGTEAAKQAADIVLADDNFATIAAAVGEGRTVYDNIRKVIAWALPTNGGETLVVAAAMLFGGALPLLPVQVLWINLVTDTTLALALAFEPAEAHVMSRPPRRPGSRLLTPFLVWRVFFVSALFAAGCFGVFHYTLQAGRDLDTARTMVVNTLVVMQIFYLFSLRFLYGWSITARGITGTRAVRIALAIVVVEQLLFTYAPPFHAVFQSAPLALSDGFVVLLCGVALLVILELEKALFRRLGGSLSD